MTYEQVDEYVEEQLDAIEETHSPDTIKKVRTSLSLALFALEDLQPEDAEDESWCPFEHLYYWAPFVLVGDWK